MAVRIYMDACCLNRPFDDQSQERVRLESEAVRMILSRVAAGTLDLVSSVILTEEIGRGPIPDRRAFGNGVVEQSVVHVGLSTALIMGARDLESRWRVDPLDALHLHAAIEGGAEYLLTVDDGIIRRVGENEIAGVLKVQNPLVWIQRSGYLAKSEEK